MPGAHRPDGLTLYYQKEKNKVKISRADSFDEAESKGCLRTPLKFMRHWSGIMVAEEKSVLNLVRGRREEFYDVYKYIY